MESGSADVLLGIVDTDAAGDVDDVTTTFII
jgi:hypothetical protein